MRVEQIESRINQQQIYRMSIQQAYSNMMHKEDITKQRIQTRMQALEEQWLCFFNNNSAINFAIFRIDPADQAKLRARDYFVEGHYTTTYELYLDTLERMSSMLERITMTDNHSPHPGPSFQSPISSVNYQSSRLPRIELPKFTGSLPDWLSFKGLFVSLILKNPSITAVEKLQYLKLSLVGAASHLIKNTPLTDDNFLVTWNAVVGFYENKRLLINSALQSLFSIRRMNKESATEMEHLYTSIMQAYRSLEVLQRPVQTWDDILVYMAVQRLDSESVKAWEHHLGSSKDPPTWPCFRDFLMTRMLSLQAFEHSQNGKSTTRGNQMAHSHLSMTSANSGEASCLMCPEQHYLAYCPQYKELTVKQRKEFIFSHKLCFNCLGHHKASNCRSTKRCLKCGQHHHSTLHQSDQVSKRVTPVDNQNQLNSTPKQVSHTTQTITSMSTPILLATAQIRVIDEHGVSHPARVLLDQGSELSLITEEFVQRHRLLRESSSISLVGVGNQTSIKTRGIVHLKIRPYFDSPVEVTVVAYILLKLTSKLPTETILTSTWPHLKDLKLADPSFCQPGKIDIILGANIYGQLLESLVIKDTDFTPVAQLTKLGWIISGPGNPSTLNPRQSYHNTIDTGLQDLNNTLEKF